ncbi:hypothetical protein C5167_022469, partial [Papaver somniferum]
MGLHGFDGEHSLRLANLLECSTVPGLKVVVRKELLICGLLEVNCFYVLTKDCNFDRKFTLRMLSNGGMNNCKIPHCWEMQKFYFMKEQAMLRYEEEMTSILRRRGLYSVLHQIT